MTPNVGSPVDNLARVIRDRNLHLGTDYYLLTFDRAPLS